MLVIVAWLSQAKRREASGQQVENVRTMQRKSRKVRQFESPLAVDGQKLKAGERPCRNLLAFGKNREALGPGVKQFDSCDENQDPPLLQCAASIMRGLVA